MGSRRAGAIPYGSYPINIGKGDIGPVGQRIGSVATLGGPSGTFTGGGHNWAGVQIHRAFSDQLDHLPHARLLFRRGVEWPAFKQQLLEANAATPGGLVLNVDRNGMASITPRGQPNKELNPSAARDPRRGGNAQQIMHGHGRTAEAGGAGEHHTRMAMDSEHRQTMDRHSGRPAKVEATGKLTADIKAPHGTHVGVEGGGVFRNVEVNRQVQMAHARGGPSDGSRAALG